jgi:hypothetical protein
VVKNKKPSRRRTLVLERETITHLTEEALRTAAGGNAIIGGGDDSISFCRPCGPPPG